MTKNVVKYILNISIIPPWTRKMYSSIFAKLSSKIKARKYLLRQSFQFSFAMKIEELLLKKRQKAGRNGIEN